MEYDKIDLIEIINSQAKTIDYLVKSLETEKIRNRELEKHVCNNLKNRRFKYSVLCMCISVIFISFYILYFNAYTRTFERYTQMIIERRDVNEKIN